MSVSDLFAEATKLEEDNPSAALKLYEQILTEDDTHAAAYINAGTICYNTRRFEKAEAYYRKAIKIDPRYALAYFDLGNVLDETGRVPEAIEVYLQAVKIAPTYADAHYNLALAYEKVRQPRRALKHWQKYTKLDTDTPWRLHAKNQIARIVGASGLFLIRQTPKPRRTKRRAKLGLAHAAQ